MKNTLIIYIAMGFLFIVPLVLFNIKKIWVKKPPDIVIFKKGRLAFVAISVVVIIGFLASAYSATMKRYEIAVEKIAEKQSEAMVGNISLSDFRDYVIHNGTENVAASFDAASFPSADSVTSVRFQISSWCVPKYWVDIEGFEQVPGIKKKDSNPVYVMYLLDAGGKENYYVCRMIQTKNGWKYDWLGNANKVHMDVIKMPTKINGQWFTVKKK